MFKIIKEFIRYRQSMANEAEAPRHGAILGSEVNIYSFPRIDFQVVTATGGVIVTARHQQNQSEDQYSNSLKSSHRESREKLYVLHEDENVSERISQIIRMEMMSL
jgi:hypothetical protein